MCPADLDVSSDGLRLIEFQSGSGGIGRHTILRGWRRKAWGFKSPLPHQLFCLAIIHLQTLLSSCDCHVTGWPGQSRLLTSPLLSSFALPVSPVFAHALAKSGSQCQSLAVPMGIGSIKLFSVSPCLLVPAKMSVFEEPMCIEKLLPLES